MIKKTSLTFLVLAVLLAQSTYAAQVASFIVEANPNSASVNQAIDLKVKAVDANGVVVKDYTNNIYIEVPGIKDLQDISLPGDGIYTFSPQDQGEKTFSKGLTIKSPGTYTVQVSDIETDTVKGQTSVTIQAAGSNTSTTATPITFSSPLPGGTETNSAVSVVGNAGVKNAKVQLYLNDEKVKEEQANQNGDFTSFLVALQPGDYTLQAKVQDVNNKVIAQSDALAFTYKPTQVGALQGFDILPSKTLKQGQKASFSVRVGSDTTAVELAIHTPAGKVQKLTLDKVSDGVFSKQLLMDTAGSFAIDVNYSIGSDTKTEASAAVVSVLEGKGIKEVTYVVDPLDKTKLSLGWKPIGDVPYVLVQQGLTKDTLNTGTVLTGSTGQIQGFDVSKQSYFIRVFPSNEKGDITGEPSDIIMIEQVQGSAPVCRIEGIAVDTTKIGDQYFLTWQTAENAERYIVYRSDRPVNSISEMQKVGETSDTKFPYPFDPQAKKDGYAYYAVVAVCQDGRSLQLGGTKKVKVGPATNMMLILLISLMVFGIARMRKVSA